MVWIIICVVFAVIGILFVKTKSEQRNFFNDRVSWLNEKGFRLKSRDKKFFTYEKSNIPVLLSGDDGKMYNTDVVLDVKCTITNDLTFSEAKKGSPLALSFDFYFYKLIDDIRGERGANSLDLLKETENEESRKYFVRADVDGGTYRGKMTLYNDDYCKNLYCESLLEGLDKEGRDKMYREHSHLLLTNYWYSLMFDTPIINKLVVGNDVRLYFLSECYEGGNTLIANL